MRALPVVIAILAAVTTACGNGGDTVVPRRTAYPRVAAYDSAFVAVSDAPVALMVNRAAEVETARKADGSLWVNVRYPRYHSTIYCTLTPVDTLTIEDVVDNRMERMYRNLGTTRPTIEEVDNDYGYSNNLVLSPTLPTTPVQFIAANPEEPEWVISGAVFFDNASSITSADSLRPMIDVMTRDIKVLLNSLADNR